MDDGVLVFKKADFLLAFVILLMYGVFQYFNYGLYDYFGYVDAVEFIPPDGATYVQIASRFDEIIDGMSAAAVLTGFLNWATLPFIYSRIDEACGLAGFFFLIVNSLAVAYVFGIYSACVSKFATGAAVLGWKVLFFVIQPYFISYLLVPNKDLLVVSGVCYLISGRVSDRRVLLFGSVLAFVKIQFLFAVFLYFVSKKMKYPVFWVLFFLSVAAPVMSAYGVGVDMAAFLANAPEAVSSAKLMLSIDGVTKIPFGYILAGPLRIALNLFAGLTFGRFFKSISFVDYVSAITSISLGVLVLWGGCIFWKNRYVALRMLGRRYYFSVCYVLSMSLVPFLQTRYYWFLIPVLLMLMLEVRRDG